MKSFSGVLSLSLLLVVTVRADFWDDLKNNLATDLTPILALFGEQLTKQYLSESLFMIDHFIFAMAPIGILTVVVSAIRVCGSASLRAFIGRAQEGGGAVEAELCSSTSRDVCELYTNGGIARVFGSPKILEVVHVLDKDTGETYSDRIGSGLFSFQEYQSLFPECSWAEKGPLSKFTREHEPDVHSFAPKPNLSLNVGIRKCHRAWIWAAAILGCLLQILVLVFATLVTFYFQWPKDDRPAAGYAYPFTVFGTIMVCGGVYLCAFLIGNSTSERHFARMEQSAQPHAAHLLWVQPGGQILGDQTFDAFAYSDHNGPLMEYSNSWKETATASHKSTRQDYDRLLLFLAILMTAIGFITQFVGLRGIHSTVSLLQLGVTMIMSGIRALLRTQRLRMEDNCFSGYLDLVRGHELDWIALALAQHVDRTVSKEASKGRSHQELQDGDFRVLKPEFQALWLFFGTPWVEKNVLSFSKRNPEVAEHLKAGNFTLNSTPSSRFETDPSSNCSDHPPPENNSGNTRSMALRALCYRARFAQLTEAANMGNEIIASSSDWGGNIIEVRQFAKSLARAIEGTAKVLTFGDSILEHSGITGPITASACLALPFQCAMGATRDELRKRGTWEQPHHHVFYITLPRRRGYDGSFYNEWIADEHAIEAILGLWLWSLKWDPQRRISSADTQSLRSDAASIKRYRILSACKSDCAYQRVDQELGLSKHNLAEWLDKEEIKEWHEPKALSTNGSFAQDMANARTVWDLDGGSRLFGWEAAHLTSQDFRHGSSRQISFLLAPTDSSLIALCSQEIYATFLSRILSLVQEIGGKTIISPEPYGRKYYNSEIAKLTDMIVDNNLGSRREALSCIIPIMRTRVKQTSISQPNETNSEQIHKELQELKEEFAVWKDRFPCPKHPPEQLDRRSDFSIEAVPTGLLESDTDG